MDASVIDQHDPLMHTRAALRWFCVRTPKGELPDYLGWAHKKPQYWAPWMDEKGPDGLDDEYMWLLYIAVANPKTERTIVQNHESLAIVTSVFLECPFCLKHIYIEKKNTPGSAFITMPSEEDCGCLLCSLFSKAIGYTLREEGNRNDVTAYKIPCG